MSKGPEATENLVTVKNGKASNAAAGVGCLAEHAVPVTELVSEDYVKE